MKRVVAIALASLAFTPGAAPRSPAPGPASEAYVRGTRAADDAACVRCHRAVAGGHAASLHARAFTDPSFQKGYRAEAKAFCRGCHAPESAPSEEPDAFAREHGVTCVTCHRPDASGAVLAAVSARPSRAPHPVNRMADFGTRACTGCHDFAFPGAEANGEKGRMQKTAIEHARSPFAAESCADCHMRNADHRFVASRDQATLASALEVATARDAGGDAVFVLSSRGVGHAFPTGDLFRRLVLRVRGERGALLERPLERLFRAERDPRTGDYVRYEAADHRLRDRQSVTVPLRGGLDWEVAYQRVTGVSQTPPFTADVEDETVLARGHLP